MSDPVQVPAPIPVPNGNPFPSVLANTLDTIKKGCKNIRDDEQIIHGAILSLVSLGYLVSAPVASGQVAGVTVPQQYIPGPALIALYQNGGFPPGGSTYGWLDTPDYVVQVANACGLLDFALAQPANSTSVTGQLATPPSSINDQPYSPLAVITMFGIAS